MLEKIVGQNVEYRLHGKYCYALVCVLNTWDIPNNLILKWKVCALPTETLSNTCHVFALLSFDRLFHSTCRKKIIELMLEHFQLCRHYVKNGVGILKIKKSTNKIQQCMELLFYLFYLCVFVNVCNCSFPPCSTTGCITITVIGSVPSLCNLGKSVWNPICDIFSFVFDCQCLFGEIHFAENPKVKTPPESDQWFQSYEQLKDSQNNRKQKGQFVVESAGHPYKSKALLLGVQEAHLGHTHHSL